ncbi:MAG: phosphate transport system regulatory protein PhoU [Caldilineae bacterium]|nr:MAG: phosphate transport system regulatory protein PhoU [Caldilineae bacterium]
MARKTFDQRLSRLQDDILLLGDRVEKALALSVQYLKERDSHGARRLIAEDRDIDETRYQIEAAALMLIATQQPMASDMRLLAAVLFIANELERIGDYAKGICRIILRIGDQPLLKPLIDIPRMEAETRKMLHASLQAFVARDVEQARAITTWDDEVDALYEQVYRELITKVLAEPSGIEQANLLLWAAHNLERAADRVTNICERVIYCVTGEFIDTGWEDEGVSAL